MVFIEKPPAGRFFQGKVRGMRKVILLLFFTTVLLLHGCTEKKSDEDEGRDASVDSQAALTNPASAYCVEHDGSLEIRRDAEGNETGFCVFADGTECEEWAYYRGECYPNSASDGGSGRDAFEDERVVGMPNPASVNCIDLGGTLEIHDVDAGELGVCVFPDGAMCEEWALFRGECSAEAPNFCETESDCACGVHITSRECFFGQKEFVDTTEQCPDFCTGIAGNFRLQCVQFTCAIGI